MSSKKARRKKQRAEAQEDRRRAVSPVMLFILGIGVAVLVTVIGAVIFGGGSDRGDPPWPGAVWSSSHGHWH